MSTAGCSAARPAHGAQPCMQLRRASSAVRRIIRLHRMSSMWGLASTDNRARTANRATPGAVPVRPCQQAAVCSHPSAARGPQHCVRLCLDMHGMPWVTN